AEKIEAGFLFLCQGRNRRGHQTDDDKRKQETDDFHRRDSWKNERQRLILRTASESTTSTTLARINTVEMALSEGSSPFFAMPKTLSVSVCDSGPVVKRVTMYSSSESVNDMSAPDTIAGSRYGTITSQNAFSGGAPRSIAASSRKGST